MDNVIELNVGGVHYSTTKATLIKEKDSKLCALFNDLDKLTKDNKGRIFLDRDGVLFRYVLDFLRDEELNLPDGFREKGRLRKEAEFFKLNGLVDCLRIDGDAKANGCITIGYRGSFQFGKEGLADVKFRKLSRILVCGRRVLCRDVFGDTLNESRDPDHGGVDRYTSRFFLKHCFIELAFDMLQNHGFQLASSCGSGTAGSVVEPKPGVDAEENRWNHYNEFVFIRK